MAELLFLRNSLKGNAINQLISIIIKKKIVPHSLEGELFLDPQEWLLHLGRQFSQVI